MSGFLHRLSALAMGSRDSTLHSVARLPYAIPPASIRNEETDRQAATSGTRANKRYPMANSGAELDHVVGQNQPRGGFHTDFDVQDRDKEVVPSSLEVLIAQSATGLTSKPGLEITPSSVKSRLRQPETSEKNTTSGESPDWDEVIKTHGTLNNFATNPIANEGPYATLTDSATPPPLLPLQNTAHPSALNSGAFARRGDPRGAAWQSQVEETTEVHVSIGRIEVTAVHEAPPPKRPAPATAKPMTLDEYLARRQRQS
jgi:hypothetical protein